MESTQALLPRAEESRTEEGYESAVGPGFHSVALGLCGARVSEQKVRLLVSLLPYHLGRPWAPSLNVPGSALDKTT